MDWEPETIKIVCCEAALNPGLLLSPIAFGSPPSVIHCKCFLPAAQRLGLVLLVVGLVVVGKTIVLQIIVLFGKSPKNSWACCCWEHVCLKDLKLHIWDILQSWMQFLVHFLPPPHFECKMTSLLPNMMMSKLLWVNVIGQPPSPKWPSRHFRLF